MAKDTQLPTPMSAQKFAIDIAYRLSSLRNFLEASEDLCRYHERLTNADFQRHGRKVHRPLHNYMPLTHFTDHPRSQLLAIMEVYLFLPLFGWLVV